MSTITVESCTIRPELIEFQKNSTHLSFIAYSDVAGVQPDEFRFTKHDLSQVDNDLTQITFTDKYADIRTDTIHTANINTTKMSLVSEFDMISGGNGYINMNGGKFHTNKDGSSGNITIQEHRIDMGEDGSIVNIDELKFFESGKTNTLSIKNDTIEFGENNGVIDLNQGDITAVQTLTMIQGAGDINMNNSSISNVDKITFNGTSAENLLDMTNVNCTISIGDIDITTDRIDSRVGGNIEIEDTKFKGDTITTTKINPLVAGDGVTVFDALFKSGEMRVETIHTNTILPYMPPDGVIPGIDTMGGSLHLYTTGKCGHIEVGVYDPNTPDGPHIPARITNVANPMDGRDAANKQYVNEAVEQNIQGLKPKKACDYALFKDDWLEDMTGQTSRFGSSHSSPGTDKLYFFGFIPDTNTDIDKQHDDSTLVLFLADNFNTDAFKNRLMLGGYNVSDSFTVLNESFESRKSDSKIPAISRKRILFNDLNQVNYKGKINQTQPIQQRPNQYFSYTEVLETNLHFQGSDWVKGLNGIWEIEQFKCDDTCAHLGTSYSQLYLKRAEDMNENKEIMNKAYTYVMNGDKKDFGFVVNNADPLRLELNVDIVNTGAIVIDNPSSGGDPSIISELKWVEFNQVNYELDFLTMNDSIRFEDLDIAGRRAQFGKGGILMRSTESQQGEKEIMLDTSQLSYGVISPVDNNGNDNELAINGDISFTPTIGTETDPVIIKDSVSKITAPLNSGKSVAGSINMMNSIFTWNDDGISGQDTSEGKISTNNIFCGQCTCSSDIVLKKNIVPITTGLELVSKFKPVTYNWKVDQKCILPEYGFIAQDVQEHFPTLVAFNEETGILSVDYMKTVSILTSSIQELMVKVEHLESKLKS